MSRIRADRYTNRAGTGAPTFSDGVNVVGITSVKSGAGVTTLEVTGDLSVISGTIKGASELSISGITSSISDTAVDVFVYDTSKDSDGGDWRKRTQNTSWYNETLNTATRGSRKEFPSVAVIVVELGNNGDTALTVYDGDDPDLPMWMVFISNSGSYLQSTCTSISALNGTFVVGGSNRLRHWNYIDESAYSITVSNTSKNNGNISQRNSQSGWYQVNTNTIVNGAINDVAMTVLPNAPIDSATGLPVPTIVVATDGGTSLIADDGNVYDDTDTSALGSVDFNDEYRVISTRKATGSQAARFFISQPVNTVSSDSAWLYDYYTGNFAAGYPRLRLDDTGAGVVSALQGDTCARGSNIGFTLWNVNKEDELSTGGNYTNSLLCGIATSYNTGYMQGDIKGAFLSDTSTSFTYGSELVTNGTFDTDISGWSSFNSVLSHQTDAIRVADNGSWSKAYQSFITVIGKEYLVKVVIKTISGNSAFAYVGAQNPAQTAGNDTTIVDGVTSTGTYYGLFTATATTSYVEVTSDSTSYVEYSEISVKENAPGLSDRSVNNNGLVQYGTITRTAVATGADLVGYSGFSASDYLQQPYNSELAPGTGQYSVSCWFKTGSTSSDQYIFDRSVDGSPRNLLLIRGSSSSPANVLQFYHVDASGNQSDLIASDFTVTDDIWHHVVALCDGSTYRVYVNGAASATINSTIRDVDNTDTPPLYVGVRYSLVSPMTGQLALFRYSLSAPSPEQIKKMYEDEKYLFQENSQATLYGSSDAVTALAYDDTTNILHAGTSAGRSEFQGLRRINNTTTAVTTALSASNELVAEQ